MKYAHSNSDCPQHPSAHSWIVCEPPPKENREDSASIFLSHRHMIWDKNIHKHTHLSSKLTICIWLVHPWFYCASVWVETCWWLALGTFQFRNFHIASVFYFLRCWFLIHRLFCNPAYTSGNIICEFFNPKLVIQQEARVMEKCSVMKATVSCDGTSNAT